ncbi:MAG: aspartate kinase [Proteobacteria bacterium]|nr:aspartate kinase [Pseudomonadota bacterium]
MALIVQKYGGTSVADGERIKKVAQRVIRAKEAGDDVIIVVSAMAGETEKLINLAHELVSLPDGRELDVMISTGEQVSIALVSMAIKSMGHEAKSYLGYQVPIQTDSVYGKARITHVKPDKIMRDLKAGKIVVVAGFQGIDDKGNVTTLGRGGSDTTAVALAASLKADVCEIYTDVDGVYTTDPNVCEKARKLERISYDEMLEMASLGAKVLQIRAVEFAKKYNVPIYVGSSFNENIGTFVCREDEEMENVAVSGITYDKNEAKITITKVPDKPGIAHKLFGAIADAHILIDMIIQNVSEEGLADITFTVMKADLHKATSIVREIARQIGARDITTDENIAKVSIVGTGMRSHSGIASTMFGALAGEGINIMMISTSEIKISCVIESKYTELAVRALHDAFHLDKRSSDKESSAQTP